MRSLCHSLGFSLQSFCNKVLRGPSSFSTTGMYYQLIKFRNHTPYVSVKDAYFLRRFRTILKCLLEPSLKIQCIWPHNLLVVSGWLSVLLLTDKGLNSTWPSFWVDIVLTSFGSLITTSRLVWTGWTPFLVISPYFLLTRISHLRPKLYLISLFQLYLDEGHLR